MTKKKKNKFKVIEFDPEKRRNKTPEFVCKKLEQLSKKAKERKLKTIIVHYEYELDPEEISTETKKKDNLSEDGTFFWNDTANIIEILGLIELIKTVALSHAMEFMGFHNNAE